MTTQLELEARRFRGRLNYYRHRAKRLKQARAWKARNKMQQKIYMAAYRKKHLKRLVMKNAIWVNNNRKRWRANKRRLSRLAHEKLKGIVRNRLTRILRKNNLKKENTTVGYLGTSIAEFKTYIEGKFQPGMTWENRGFYGWHIDHVRPVSSFNLHDPDQLKACTHYTNLQPLWMHDNLSKGNRLEA